MVGEDGVRNPYIYFLGFLSKLTSIFYQSREGSLPLPLSFGNRLRGPARTTVDGLGLVGVYYVIGHSVYGLWAGGTVSEGMTIGNLSPGSFPGRAVKIQETRYSL